MAVTTGAVAGRKGSDVQQDRRYASEAELRDHLAAVARDCGWTVAVEWRLSPLRARWGTADLLLTKHDEQPVIVECKHRIATGSGLRAAASQAHSYSTVASTYLGDRCAAYVVAESIAASRAVQHVALGYLDVHSRTAADMVDLLDRDGREPGYAQFDRDLTAWIYGSTARGEFIDDMAALLAGHSLETLADLRELHGSFGDLTPSSSVYDRLPRRTPR